MQKLMYDVLYSKKERWNMTIGKRINTLRKERGMSIDDLADKLGKNRTTIYRYENGDIENLPLDILDPLAKALNTTPAHLMGWDTKNMSSMRIIDGEKESTYLCTDATNVKHVDRWHKEFGLDPFSDEEHEKLIEYAKFLISLRNE